MTRDDLDDLIRWIAKAWLRFLRWWQRAKPLEMCAYPTCTEEWHSHIGGVRVCDNHEP